MSHLEFGDPKSLPESKALEFKRGLYSPKPHLNTLVAFANTAGGKLVIGVDNSRQVVGIAEHGHCC